MGVSPPRAQAAVEDRPADRNEAWLGLTPNHDLGPDRVLFTDERSGYLIDAMAAQPIVDSQALPGAAPPQPESASALIAPLPSAGWAGMVLLLGMGLWRSAHLRAGSRPDHPHHHHHA